MRVRKQVLAVALATTALMASASPALAQGPARSPATVAVARAPLTMAPSPLRAERSPADPIAPPLTLAVPGPTSPVLPGVERALAPPVVLGQAWACAVRTVLDGMKHLVDAHKLAAEPLSPHAPPLPPTPEAPSIPAWRARWTLTGAMREAIAASPVQVGPTEAATPLEVSRDTHGENAILLGARVDLPWMVP
jgi:hypothetical protein